jgi:addiction module HigA family antidote
MAANRPYNPDYAVPPGATIRETLEEKGITQGELAKRMCMSRPRVNQIINGKAPLTTWTAFKLECVLDISAAFWQARESSYRKALRKTTTDCGYIAKLRKEGHV